MNPNMMNRNVSYYGTNRNRMNNCDTNCGHMPSPETNPDNNCGCTQPRDMNKGNNCGHMHPRNANKGNNCGHMHPHNMDNDANCGSMKCENMMCGKYAEANCQQLESMSQQQLLSYLNQVSFSMYDATLFLDTHPCDREAMAYFNEMQHARKYALDMYQKKFGPLLLDDVDADCEWTWGMQPLPWEPMC